jgi:hypothetical protein
MWLLERIESPSDHWPLGVFSSLAKAKAHAEKRCAEDEPGATLTPASWMEDDFGHRLCGSYADYIVSEEELDPEVGPLHHRRGE